MARKVKISSVGKQPPHFPLEEKTNYEALAKAMTRFWKAQVDLVLPDRPDMIVLPELCDRYMNTPQTALLPYRKTLGTRMLDAMRQIARDHNCYVVYPSAFEEKDGTWRNAAAMIDRGGAVIGRYNKNHTVVTEIDNGILCGKDAPLIECDFGTVAIAICFDLNFEELRLKYQALHPDLIIFPSAYHGGLMEAYWAYSCRAHFVSCTVSSLVPSEFYSPVGSLLATSTNYYQYVTHTVNLDCAVVHRGFNQEKLLALKQKYGPDVTIFDPGKLGCELITSESDAVSAKEMMAELEIESIDDYFARSLAHQHNPANRES